MRFFVNPQSSTSVLGMIYKQTAEIKDAQILAFAPPMVSGFSATNGLTFTMQDKTGGDLNKFFEITKTYLAELNKRPEISNAMTSYNPNYPQYMVDVDVAKCKQAGIGPSTVLSTLQGYYGGLYASNFNAYGKLYRVMIQGDVESRMRPEGLTSIYVRTPSGMSPVSEFCTLHRVLHRRMSTVSTSLRVSTSMQLLLTDILQDRPSRLLRRLLHRYCQRATVSTTPV